MATTSDDGWGLNLRRTGGFYKDPDWYSLQLDRKMPLVPKMLDELVFALPPLKEGRVCDLASGNGNAAVKIKDAYPRISLAVVEKEEYRIKQCRQRLAAIGHKADEFCWEISLLEGSEHFAIPGAPYDCIVASLGIHTLVGHGVSEETAVSQYTKAFQLIFSALWPGGHFIYGDHVGVLPLYRQLRLLEDAGFTEIDVSWREEAFFVAGGRRRPK